MKYYSVVVLLFYVVHIESFYDNEITLKCRGRTYENVSLTAYYPDYNDQDSGLGYQDKKRKRATNFTGDYDFVDGRAEFVTLAMDPKLEIPYGSKICIPELNNHYGHRILLEVRDSSIDLYGGGYSRAEICVRSEIDSYDKHVNRIVNLVFVD
ncbi:hypothetical protein NQ317_009897 [Molorchus minor]|uniref:3D domain-containing protein n=1 Tax=Molorchus minor TaxID=1323400 RepID=A0ABQ9IUQ7_9CUCU|nr:hypothetical protein NQ317_009897 [Molorchus minor]